MYLDHFPNLLTAAVPVGTLCEERGKQGSPAVALEVLPPTTEDRGKPEQVFATSPLHVPAGPGCSCPGENESRGRVWKQYTLNGEISYSLANLSSVFLVLTGPCTTPCWGMHGGEMGA